MLKIRSASAPFLAHVCCACICKLLQAAVFQPDADISSYVDCCFADAFFVLVSRTAKYEIKLTSYTLTNNIITFATYYRKQNN